MSTHAQDKVEVRVLGWLIGLWGERNKRMFLVG